MGRDPWCSTEQRDMLESRARARSASARSVERARIDLLAAGGMQDRQIAADCRQIESHAGEGSVLAEPGSGRRVGGPGRHRDLHVRQPALTFSRTSDSLAVQTNGFGSSWLNMVERFFRDLTEQRLRRGIFRDVDGLIMATSDYIDKHNPCWEIVSACRRPLEA